MHFHVALSVAILAIFALPTQARQSGDSAREACREEARKATKPGHTSRLDREQLKEMRREYARDCRRRSKAI